MMNEEIVHMKFSFPVPSDLWFSKYFLKYPLIHFTILSSFLLTENKGSCLIQVRGPNISIFLNDFSENYEKKKVTIIYQDPNSILLNILIEDPWILHNITKNHLLIRYPLQIFKGIISIELISPRTNIEKVFRNSKWKDLNITVKQVREYCPESLLTAKQTEILIYALENGFFEIPRKITLSSMASKIKLTPSALSENIRRITKKLVVHYLNCFEKPL
ncbi:helix-turn-helix domain-containing protein [Candidatus Harpocratesius sp.]